MKCSAICGKSVDSIVANIFYSIFASPSCREMVYLILSLAVDLQAFTLLKFRGLSCLFYEAYFSSRCTFFVRTSRFLMHPDLTKYAENPVIMRGLRFGSRPYVLCSK